VFLALLTQIDWNKLRPEQIFGGQVLERTPAGLSIIFIIGVGILIGFLCISFFDNFRRPQFLFEFDLPREVKRKLTQTIANRSIRAWQFVFFILAFTVFGFQVYWTYFADESNEQFQALAYKDLRNRRTSAAALRGWMLDRTGKLDSALAYYKVTTDGEIDRTFSLEKEMAHLLGTERGTPGLERTLYTMNADPMPEAWEILTTYRKPEPENRDVRITIHRELQAFAAKQLEGKKGGIVVINPQTGDVLAMYSNPSYSLAEAESLEGYLKLEADRENKPLLNRATREFYIPGSTFKTFTMVSAFRAGRAGQTFPGRPTCYVPFRGSKPICDAGGGCHACSENIPIREAYKVSSNQYFAQMANALGRQRLAESARIFGIMPTETPEQALSQGFFPDIWNASNSRIANSIAPARSTIVTGEDLTAFDLGQIGMGQGYAGQMTPFQMALIAAGPANMQGQLMRPKIEVDIQPQVFSQVLSPQHAAVVREIMSTVTEEAGGTGARVKAKLAGSGIITGGKTGTAEKDGVPAYDRNGKRITATIRRRGANGEMETYQEPVFRRRTDGWFISIAPLENPQLAIAVVVEDIGDAYGGSTAAPIAADVILKARDLGLLGERYKPQPAQAAPAQRRRARR
jgi:cell division protein FtsI/penicillin-binding protein 2